MSATPLAYPLDWPVGVPRSTKVTSNWAALGKGWTLDRATRAVLAELRRMGAEDGPVISTNLTLRNDGLPRSGQVQPKDPGVAVYWRKNGELYALACDAHHNIERNLRAIAKHLEALRGLERWGCGTAEQAFHGYKALPPPKERLDWERYFALERESATREDVIAAFRESAKRCHPDAPGGDADDFRRLVEMRDAALAALNGEGARR